MPITTYTQQPGGAATAPVVAVPVAAAAPVSPAVAAKPALKTSEFWGKTVLQLIGLLGPLAHLLPGEMGLKLAVLLEMAYAISRGLTKLGLKVPALPAPPAQEVK